MFRPALILLLIIVACPALAQQPTAGGAPKKVALDPNERICEDIYVGTRVNAQRFCATRAEWAARKQQDRENVEQAQRPRQCNAIMSKHC
jgi:hypothetical protein